jgi:hypothetical protein
MVVVLLGTVRAVAAEAYPAVPAWNSCTVAPLTGCEPAITIPLSAGRVPELETFTVDVTVFVASATAEAVIVTPPFDGGTTGAV